MFTVDLSRVTSYSRRKRAKKAMAILREQVEKREEGDISVDPEVNHEIWKEGIENPPKKLEVEVKQTEKGKVVRLADTASETTEEEKSEDSGAESSDPEQDEYEDILEGTVGEAKEAIKEMDSPDYQKLKELEEQGKDRKTLKEFLESKS